LAKTFGLAETGGRGPKQCPAELSTPSLVIAGKIIP
jgi:hypothetical protein